MKEEFLEYLEYQKKYSKHTIINYSLDIDRYLLYLKSKNYDYKNIKYEKIGEYLNYLNDIKLSPSSISRSNSSLRSFYKYLIKKDYVKSNPFNLISSIKKQKRLPNYVSFNEFEEILKYCGNDALGIRNRSILEMLIASGLRVSELTMIKLKDINFKERSIKVIGKGDKMRTCYYGEYAEESLNKYLNNARDILLKGKSSNYLYINNLGNGITSRGVELIVENLIKKAGSEKNISPHTFRHSFATMMINEGASIKTVQELLGHLSLDTTSIYTHITNDKLRSTYLDFHPRAKK